MFNMMERGVKSEITETFDSRKSEKRRDETRTEWRQAAPAQAATQEAQARSPVAGSDFINHKLRVNSLHVSQPLKANIILSLGDDSQKYFSFYFRVI